MSWKAALAKQAITLLFNLLTLFLKPAIEKWRKKRAAKNAIADGDDASDWMRKHSNDSDK